jgi:tetratricopeptide (TPR) repeat protein
LNERGQLLQQQGRYREAARVLARAVPAAERAFGANARAIASPLNNLGVCCKFLGRFTEAGALYQRALHIVERRLGPEHAEVATIYHNLGGLEHAAGNWLRGEPFARRALRIRRRALGPRHPSVAHDMTALAALLDRQRKFDEAERLYLRSIAMLERTYGTDTPELAVPLNNLAAVYQARGRPKQAEALYRRALAIDAAAGPPHPRAAYCANNLAMLLAARGRLREASELFRDAVAVMTTALGSDAPTLGACLENYAGVLRKLRRRRKAASCARRAKAILGRVEAVNDEGIGVTGTINPEFARYRLLVKPSRIHRMGVFADEQIPRGRKVIEYTGERIARTESKRRWNPARSYIFLLDSYWRLDGAIGGSGAELINHSCDPNLKARMARGHILYFSKRRIARGEELTVDYKYDEDLERMACNCGAPTCRGTMNENRRRESEIRSRRRRSR